MERIYGIDNEGLELAIYIPEIGVKDELVKKGIQNNMVAYQKMKAFDTKLETKIGRNVYLQNMLVDG